MEASSVEAFVPQHRLGPSPFSTGQYHGLLAGKPSSESCRCLPVPHPSPLDPSTPTPRPFLQKTHVTEAQLLAFSSAEGQMASPLPQEVLHVGEVRKELFKGSPRHPLERRSTSK